MMAWLSNHFVIFGPRFLLKFSAKRSGLNEVGHTQMLERNIKPPLSLSLSLSSRVLSTHTHAGKLALSLSVRFSPLTLSQLWPDLWENRQLRQPRVLLSHFQLSRPMRERERERERERLEIAERQQQEASLLHHSELKRDLRMLDAPKNETIFKTFLIFFFAQGIQ